MLPPLTLSGWHRYDLIRSHMKALAVRSVLEIGPGLGGLGARLAADYDYVGVEVDAESAQMARDNLRQLGRGRIATGTPETIGERFDVVCAFEVLEHVEDDAAALAQWRNQINPLGWLALSVPAWPHRWGAHDERAGHFRRYERGGLAALVRGAGFTNVVVLGYGFPLLTAMHPFWDRLSARGLSEETLEERTHASGRFRQPPTWAGAITQLVAFPFVRLQRFFIDSDQGTGFVVFAQRVD